MRYLESLAAALTIGLASFALWRVIAVDALTKPLRAKVFTEARQESSKFYQWLKLWAQCPWCAGAWVTALLTLLTDLFVEDGLPAPFLVFAAARAVTGYIGSHDEDYQSLMMRGEG